MPRHPGPFSVAVLRTARTFSVAVLRPARNAAPAAAPGCQIT
ncbi:hypothetical protein QE418_002323 [Microbacterium testaceum]|nr:hypothetical protein [Microbacterium testaceum]MDR6096587.1 hypothetical protein [Microbacterium sp. SORGH_AS_0454]